MDGICTACCALVRGLVEAAQPTAPSIRRDERLSVLAYLIFYSVTFNK